MRELVVSKDTARVSAIIDQLVNDYAYAVHAPHARNGGLIGLAAAAIALGSELPRYLEAIVPPVLACFTDQDARVRYYACEAMYNIAKVAKGEILVYFNFIFDALCKLGADSELSVKNGAELLDRLVKDIVSESAATYVSVLEGQVPPPYDVGQPGKDEIKTAAAAGAEGEAAAAGEGGQAREGSAPLTDGGEALPTAFSLKRFIPLLRERIYALNPFTRTFLVGWIVLLDAIPDLELVTYLPEFLGGLLKFLSDTNPDVRTATQGCLNKFLDEIKRISRVKKGIAESRKEKGDGTETQTQLKQRRGRRREGDENESIGSLSVHAEPAGAETAMAGNEADVDASSLVMNEDEVDDDEVDDEEEEDWVPGQDVQINYKAILEILTNTLDSPLEKDSLPESLRWLVGFLEICPEEVLPFTPKILAHLLPAMASGKEAIRQAATAVNNSLMDYVVTLGVETEMPPPQQVPSRIPGPLGERQDGTTSARASMSSSRDLVEGRSPTPAQGRTGTGTPVPATVAQASSTAGSTAPSLPPAADLDYAAAVNSLTLLFLNDHEATRVAALTWLIMLHRKAPRKVLAFNDGTFPALLKTLSDPAEAVVTKDLQLLSQISRNSEDDYFSNFMVNLLQLFSTDRKLLETRGNLIIRQLCVSLSPERIYRTLADCIEREEDVEFASIMVQNLNNNLITAPELAELRKRLRNLETKDGQTFFVTLFRSWCYNAVATFSLCLLAQAYEQAYNLLQIFAELEMTVSMLIQIDKLVQLLESPVFTCRAPHTLSTLTFY
jgi:vacuole morphology and inheritance protein 14